MKLRSEFTEIECEWFRSACNFTPGEAEVFELRIRDKSRVEIALALNVSEATVDRRIKAIKNKINKVL